MQLEPRSLNYLTRRRENERIEKENHNFAKRLFSNAATIKKADLDDSYQVMSQIKHRIKRHRKLAPLPATSRSEV